MFLLLYFGGPLSLLHSVFFFYPTKSTFTCMMQTLTKMYLDCLPLGETLSVFMCSKTTGDAVVCRPLFICWMQLVWMWVLYWCIGGLGLRRLGTSLAVVITQNQNYAFQIPQDLGAQRDWLCVPARICVNIYSSPMWPVAQSMQLNL